MKRLTNNSVLIYLLVVLLTVFISWIDKITGLEIRVFIFYFIPIALAAWQGGKFIGVIAAVFAVLGWAYSNYDAGSSAFVWWWNAAVMLVAFLMVALATAWIGRDVKELRRLLPICAWCKKIRDDSGYWEQVESYFQKRDRNKFTHSICPECSEKFYKPVLLCVEAEPEEVSRFKNAVTKADLPHLLFFVETADQAVAWLESKHPFVDRTKTPAPDVLMIDLRLRGADGFELLRQVRTNKEFKDLPVLVVSASDAPEEIKRAYELGATSFFAKTPSYTEVTEFLRTSRH